MYNKSKQTSTNNVLPMEIYIIFGINSNSSSADRREGTNLDAFSDFTKNCFLILEIASQLAVWQFKQVALEKLSKGKERK